MNEKKFCFISCVNNSQYYEECLYYINKINVPIGYEIEVLSIEDSKGMASGYNEAMNASDAKYKIYLHQDTFIINENFLYDILYTFENNSDIGMIGVVGSKVIPTSAIWWETNHKYGKVYESSAGNLSELKFKDVEKRYEQVKIIDGLIMITQYDLPWRDDVFDGYHFYDASQSTEFTKKGYKVIVPNQDKPWIIHDCGMAGMGYYGKYRQKFIDEYYKDIFPLVSILIPTYNRPKYFKLALESAINQTYKNIEIVVGDDGTDNKTEKLIENYLNKYDNIRYYHNKSNLGQFDNDLKLMDMSKGRYVNFLMDDDLFEKDKIQKMINVFIEDDKNEISLVSSNRKLIDGEGIFKTNYILDETIGTVCDKVWNGEEITELILSQNKNIIGEPTTVLFDKTKMTEKFGYYDNRRFICNVDQATWFNLLKDGKCIILSEILSSFRMHNNQQLEFKENVIGEVKDYSYLIINAPSNNLFLDNEQYLTAIDTCLQYAKKIKSTYRNCNIEKIIQELTEVQYEVKSKIPLLSVVVNCKDNSNDIYDILDKIKTNIYSNIELIFINRKHQEMDVENSECINIYDYVESINEDENIDRAMHNILGEYIMYIDDSNLELINENSLDMMKFHANNDIAIAIKGIGIEKNQIILGKYMLGYIVRNISKIIDRKIIYIINKSYYINKLGTYFDKTFTYNRNLASICSALRFGNGICFDNNEKYSLMDDSDWLQTYLESLQLIKAIKIDKYLDSILDYQNAINELFEKINFIVNKNNWNQLTDEIQRFKSEYQINTKNLKFYDYGYNTLIRDGAEVVCEEAISIGNNTLIKEDSTLMVPYYNFNGNPRIIIGDNCDIGKRIFISAVNRVEIEDEVIIASNVHITDHNHEYKKIGIPIRRQGVDSFENEVKIGFGTWIGNNVVVVGNVKIGRGCVIGANSLVNSDIPDYCVVAGQPAKIIKYLNINNGKWEKVSSKEQYKMYLKQVQEAKPFLTIGIPTYNRAAFLDKCLNNIYSQIGNDKLIEVLVKDNASQDATCKVINKYKNNYLNIRYIKNECNVSADININSIFDKANGKYVISCGDDDYYNSSIIYSLINILKDDQSVDVAFLLNNSNELKLEKGSGINDYINKISFMNTLISSIVLKRKKYNKILDKKKYIEYKLNQVYLQMEILKVPNSKFAILSGNIFRNDSGQHKHVSKEYNFAKVFLNNYLEILNQYTDKQLSKEVFTNEKLRLLNNMIIPWIVSICAGQCDLEIDSLLEYYKKYYCDEEYYNEKLLVLKDIISKSVRG